MARGENGWRSEEEGGLILTNTELSDFLELCPKSYLSSTSFSNSEHLSVRVGAGCYDTGDKNILPVSKCRNVHVWKFLFVSNHFQKHICMLLKTRAPPFLCHRVEFFFLNGVRICLPCASMILFCAFNLGFGTEFQGCKASTCQSLSFKLYCSKLSYLNVCVTFIIACTC